MEASLGGVGTLGNEAISFKDVHLTFGKKTPIADTRKHVLKGLNLEIYGGETVCVLGPSGCGKTTAVNLVMGILVPTEGEVRVMGEKAPYGSVRPRMGFMPQDEALYNDITAEENLRFFGLMEGMAKAELDARVEEMLEFTRLAQDRNRLVSSFSGGMKRRLSLAIALLHNPDVLVLDEPTVGLDPDHRKRIWGEFERMRQRGVAILVTTHVMDEAARCGRVVMMHGGVIIAQGSPAEIVRNSGAQGLEDAFLRLQRKAEQEGEGHE